MFVCFSVWFFNHHCCILATLTCLTGFKNKIYSCKGNAQFCSKVIQYYIGLMENVSCWFTRLNERIWNFCHAWHQVIKRTQVLHGWSVFSLIFNHALWADTGMLSIFQSPKQLLNSDEKCLEAASIYPQLNKLSEHIVVFTFANTALKQYGLSHISRGSKHHF